MNYEFSQHVLLRMPVKKPIDYYTDQQIFLEDHFFCAAIRVATPAFYHILERKEFQSADLSVKESVTLQKYINRFCFRPTPFGLFSSVSLTEWQSPVREESTIPKFRPHIRASMTVQNLFAESIRERELLLKVNYKSNPSLYRVLNEYRFFRTGLDEAGKHRDYQLQSIAFSKMLKDLISACYSGLFREEVVHIIAKLAECPINEAEDYAAFLIDSQLLISCLQLNVSQWVNSLKSGGYTSDATVNLYTNGEGSAGPVNAKYHINDYPTLLVIGKTGKVININYDPRFDDGKYIQDKINSCL